MRIYILSNGVDALTQEHMTSSSSKYEMNIAKSLSRLCKVEILSTKLPFGQCTESGNLKLTGIKCHTLTRFQLGKYRKISAVLGASGSDENMAFIFWGYDPQKLLALLGLKLRHKGCWVPFIYDHHSIAIKNRRPIRRCIVDAYFKAGLLLVGLFDRFIFFQENAARELHVQKPYLVSKPGVTPRSVFTASHEDKDIFKVAFCGTLTELNGIDVLLEALPVLAGKHIELNIYGEGPLKDRVAESAERFDMVSYHGLVTDKELQTVYRNCDLLLNLRQPDDYVMNFCFPSKLFEYIESGCPVLTTKMLDDAELNNCLMLVDNMSAKNLAECIIKASQNKTQARVKAEMCRKYIEENYSYDRLSEEMFTFLNSAFAGDEVGIE